MHICTALAHLPGRAARMPRTAAPPRWPASLGAWDARTLRELAHLSPLPAAARELARVAARSSACQAARARPPVHAAAHTQRASSPAVAARAPPCPSSPGWPHARPPAGLRELTRLSPSPRTRRALARPPGYACPAAAHAPLRELARPPGRTLARLAARSPAGGACNAAASVVLSGTGLGKKSCS